MELASSPKKMLLFTRLESKLAYSFIIALQLAQNQSAAFLIFILHAFHTKTHQCVHVFNSFPKSERNVQDDNKTLIQIFHLNYFQ